MCEVFVFDDCEDQCLQEGGDPEATEDDNGCTVCHCDRVSVDGKQIFIINIYIPQ